MHGDAWGKAFAQHLKEQFGLVPEYTPVRYSIQGVNGQPQEVKWAATWPCSPELAGRATESDCPQPFIAVDLTCYPDDGHPWSWPIEGKKEQVGEESPLSLPLHEFHASSRHRHDPPTHVPHALPRHWDADEVQAEDDPADHHTFVMEDAFLLEATCVPLRLGSATTPTTSWPCCCQAIVQWELHFDHLVLAQYELAGWTSS
eukprot:516602-Amphidinium_carterae.4